MFNLEAEPIRILHFKLHQDLEKHCIGPQFKTAYFQGPAPPPSKLSTSGSRCKRVQFWFIFIYDTNNLQVLIILCTHARSFS